MAAIIVVARLKNRRNRKVNVQTYRRGLHRPRDTQGIFVTRQPSSLSALTARLLAGVIATGMATVPQITAAQAPSAQDAAAKMRANREKLEEAERKAKTLQADVAQIDGERNRLNAQLQETAKLVQRSEAQMTTIESRRDGLEGEQKALEAVLAERQESIGKLLGAMQRMGRNPPPVIITRREDALQMVRSAMLLAKAFPELRSQYEDLAGRLTALARVMGDIRTERDKLESETARLKDAQLKLASLMETKRQTLSERQEQLDGVRKAAAEISKSVEDLAELITKLDKTVADRTTLGAYDKELSKVDLDKVPVPPPPPVVVEQAPIAKPDDKKVAALPVPKAAPQASPGFELVPRGGGSFKVDPMSPKIPFQLAKGRLPLPAQGRRVISFGDKLPSGKTAQGVVIETRHAAQVTSPSDGWVLYAAEFRSFGQVLIINGGGGYNVVLTGLSQIDVQIGQFVLGGEPVGTMSAAPKGKVQGNAPVLYVEFRKEGRPVDPEPWWSDGSKKVQG
jgi:murein hydrolase activator